MYRYFYLLMIPPYNQSIYPGIVPPTYPVTQTIGTPVGYYGGMPQGPAMPVPPPGAIKAGEAFIKEEAFPVAAGMGRKIIIDEPFVVPQPPRREVISNVVHEKYSIPQAPETRIIEHILPKHITIPQPPLRQLIRETYQRPVLIPQTGRQVVQEVYRKPVVVQPPPQIQTVEDIIQKSIMVEPPPKVVTYRQEYVENPSIVGQQALPPRAIKLENELQTMEALRTKNILQTQMINQGQLAANPQVVGSSSAFVGSQLVGQHVAPIAPQVTQGPSQYVGSQVLPGVMPNEPGYAVPT